MEEYVKPSTHTPSNADNGSGGRKPPGHLSYRSRHRAASHDAAHNGVDDAGAQPLPEHPLIPRGAAELITDDKALGELLDHLRSAGTFAYDSEFIGELTYRPQLCLIQVATAERLALVDPMSGLDLHPYWSLLADDSVQKLVHAGAQDVEPVFRNIGKKCANIFDTQVAAGFCGMAYPVALSKLVNEVLHHKMPKGLTFTDWQRRPLSASQLRYAADDVRFLPALAAELKKCLSRFGHEKWVSAECLGMCEPSRYEFDPESDFLNVRGAGTLSPAQLAVLKELMIWREAQAVEADIPPRAFVRDEALIDLSRQPAKSLDRLQRVKFLPRPVVERHGRTIVELTLSALADTSKHVRRPAHVDPTPSERFRTESLWAATQAICLSQGIDPAVVTSRQEISELDRAWASGLPLDEIAVMKGWRREALGEGLLKLLRGEKTVRLIWQGSRLCPETPSN